MASASTAARTWTSVLAARGRLDFDTCLLVLRSRVRMLGRDAVAEPTRLARGIRPNASLVAAVRPRLGPGLSARESQPEDSAVHGEPLLRESPGVIRQFVALADVFDLRCDF